MSTFATRFAKIFPETKFIDIMKTSSNFEEVGLCTRHKQERKFL